MLNTNGVIPLDQEHPLRGSNEPGIGHALISTVDTDPGYEDAYSQWLDDFHFFDGVMHAPWVFSGRRWFAPPDLLALRYPDPSPVVTPLALGRFLNTFWIVRDRLDDYLRWTGSPDIVKVEDDEVRHHRAHVYTGFHDHRGTVASSAHVPSGQFSLIDPAPGLVLHVVDAPDLASRLALETHLLTEHLPARIRGNHAVMSATLFTAAPPPVNLKPEVIAASNRVSNNGTRLTILWFLAQDPRVAWEEHFARARDLLGDTPLGRTVLVAPFLPFRMGVAAAGSDLEK